MVDDLDPRCPEVRRARLAVLRGHPDLRESPTMPDDLDAARIGIQLDRAEECGAIETDVAAALRALMEPIPRRCATIEIHADSGRHAWAVTEYASAVARRLGGPVVLWFNGEKVSIGSGDDADAAYEKLLAGLKWDTSFTARPRGDS